MNVDATCSFALVLKPWKSVELYLSECDHWRGVKSKHAACWFASTSQEWCSPGTMAVQKFRGDGADMHPYIRDFVVLPYSAV